MSAEPNSAGPGTVADAASIAPGAVVSDRYRVIERLGEGGMGAVFKAEHVHMRKNVALKVLHAELSKMPEVVARFEREAVAAANIEHPNVAAATDFGRLPDGSLFLVMEYVDGKSLRDALSAGAMPPAQALGIMLGILAGLEAAHLKGIVHRDLKPENVMLVDRDGDPHFPKVLDFGIAKVDPFGGGEVRAPEAPSLTRMGTIIGTPDYMAPEQALGQPVDVRSDLYALGVIFYELLAGHPPYRGDAVTVMREHVLKEVPPLPAEVLAAIPGAGPLVTRLLAKEAKDRYQTAKDLRTALVELAEGGAPAGRLTGTGVGPVTSAVPSDAVVPATAATMVATPGAKAALALTPALGVAASSADDSARAARTKKVALAGVAGLSLVVGIGVAVALSAGGGASGPTASSASASGASSQASLASASASVLAQTSASSSASAVASADPDDDEDDVPGASSGGAKAATSAKTTTKRPRTKAKPHSTAAPRRTGPGGIYIPPPDTWFK